MFGWQGKEWSGTEETLFLLSYQGGELETIRIGKLLDSVVTVELGCSNSRKEVGSGTYYRSSRVPD